MESHWQINSMSYFKVPRFFLISSLACLLFYCAHKQNPPGGEPDKSRPFITGVYPAPNAINVATDLNISIQFSKWMNTNVKNSSVSLTPFLNRKPLLKMKGKILTITCKTPLQVNTTYTLVVKTQLTDLNNNKLNKPFQLKFSTGSILDSGTLSGEFISLKSNENVYVGMYPLQNRQNHEFIKNPDSLPHPLQERPLYLIPVDSSGIFKSEGIKNGPYAIVGFNDKNNNQKPDIYSEEVAIGPSNIAVTKTKPNLKPNQTKTKPN